MRCLTIPPDIEAHLAGRLGLPRADTGADCDLMIISGSEATTDNMRDCRAVMEPAAARGVPCYCINPDTRKLVGDRVLPGPGLLGELYEQMGGNIVWIGKPHREIYDRALGLVPDVERRRIVCIGDSIEDDIVGAQRANLDAVLVRTGVLSQEKPKAIREIMDRLHARPTFEMGRFAI